MPEVPRYDHDDLARIFIWVKERIESLLNSIRDYEYEQEYFVGVGLGMLVTLKPKWLNPDWKWYVGVAYENITDQECRELLGSRPARLEAGESVAGRDAVQAGQAGSEPGPHGPQPAQPSDQPQLGLL